MHQLLEATGGATEEAVKQSVFNIVLVNVLGRDALVRQVVKEVQDQLKHKLRISSFVGSNLFDEPQVRRAKEDLDKRREDGYGTALRKREFDTSKLKSVQAKGNRFKATNKRSQSKFKFRRQGTNRGRGKNTHSFNNRGRGRGRGRERSPEKKD